ncbi:MAG: SH3 domain-containing protein [Thermoguttaceae bacterium]
MRGPLVASLACIAAATSAAAEQPFPYRAYVTADDVYVRSGPGENYYPTDKLKAGTEVEVYRHDPGGWFAIRPPKDSFSWVSSRHLQIDGNNLATVTDEHVAARVGSRMNDARDVIQVRLHKGETVEVLEPRHNRPQSNHESTPWFKIAPPAGEFRWVSGRFVDPDYSVDGVRRTLADGTVDLTGRATGHLRGDDGVPRRTSPEQYQRQLDQIDLELSTMVVEDPNFWELRELRQRAEALFNQSETALERGRARMLVSKIARFEDIKRRKQALAASRPELARPDPPAIGSLPPADPDGRFDAKGQLIRVPDPKPGGPQYAILDARGNIRCYVSPAPGVNLRSYVGRQVGINGIRGYMPEQRASHVMARHVSVLEENVIR